MATCLFYGPGVLGVLMIYLGLRVVWGNRDSVWARYADAMAQRGQPVERTPDWDRRMRRFGVLLAVIVGGGLIALSVVNYVMFF